MCELCDVPVKTKVVEDTQIVLINCIDFTVAFCALSRVFLADQEQAFEETGEGTSSLVELIPTERTIENF